MTLICEKCGGLLVGDQELDNYQAQRWKCVNCGWYRRDGQALLGSARRHHESGRLKVRLKFDAKKGNEAMKDMSTAENPMKLVLCDCGKLHLTCGAVTLHLTRDEFLVLAESIRRLAAIVTQPSMSRPVVSAQPNSSEVCH